MRVTFTKYKLAILLCTCLGLTLTTLVLRVNRAPAETQGPGIDHHISDRFIQKLNTMLKNVDPQRSIPFADGRSLAEKTALKRVFDASILTPNGPYDIDDLPQPPPPDTALIPTDIRKAIDDGHIKVAVLGTGDRSSIKLKITNRDKIHWQLIGVPVGIQFKARSVHVQNMGVR